MYDTEAMFAGITALFQFQTLLFLVLGFLIGFIVGAIPGFNDANVMAILLPFTLVLDPTVAVIMMATIYTGAQAAGSIPAILMNIPGTPGNAASTLEGYPMARAGKAGYALGLSFGASTFGALIGAFLALVLAPVLGMFALKFGPSEMFMVAVLGLTVVSTLASESYEKGMMIALFGILVSLIGADSMSGFPRATYGIPELYDGLPMIPVLLGLFGLSELLFLLGRATIADQGRRSSDGWSEIFRGLKNSAGHQINLWRSSILGFFVGVVPGAGATIGSFLAYGQARQWSKDRESFGKGNPEGLVATDSANNATANGALVPMLTLGLPGSASTLVMLAALVLHGLRPGPEFFTTFIVDAYSILFSTFLAAGLIATLGVLLARPAQHIVFVPNAFLVPTVTVLVFIGAYAWRFMAFDIMLMIVFGLFGAILKVYRYPVPAFMLAIILGPLLESNFLRATRIGGANNLFDGPINKVLVAMIVLSLVAPLATALFRRCKK
ncbi:tripartite tricarboxylate transporter permease [Hoeflea sp. YIM 152468]|uniref:tripartite tricarboxylate transporter permease n=1 Tax=Hoeflea sp. YIM 152468 TaxID=3031759 RepID=UPI0023DB7C19|nr:tripartite tricarboxylate transporter permease [Hoeflea sp. YIM 152468]MDF1608687.1 tripartite tricarboxylate transporter permease [Hoeflea sp. YIM 152468]